VSSGLPRQRGPGRFRRPPDSTNSSVAHERVSLLE
jgi:hypothetical protein